MPTPEPRGNERPARDAGAASPGGPLAEPCVAICGARDRVRVAVRAAFPKRRARLVAVRTAAELRRVLCAELVDAVLIDVGGGAEDAWAAAGLARAFTSTPFVAVAPLRASEGEMLDRCAALGVADVLVDGVDDAAVRGVVAPLLFSARFAAAFADPPPALGLGGPLPRGAWARIVDAAGRLTRTAPIAASLGVTREHLSRSFSGEAATLKGMIDLVRVLVAAELARSPGYQIRDLAAVLGFATPSHLARATARVAGRAPSALSAATGADLVAAFVARQSGRQAARPLPADHGGAGPGVADRAAASPT